MRNIGGGIGIAVTGTMLARTRQANSALLGEHVSPYSQMTSTVLEQLKAGFMAAGADVVSATNQAYIALYGMIQRQAAMVAFVNIFRLLGTLFLVLIPLVLIMRRPKGSGGPPAAH
jgi:DHA2 family multidrug resistance protein